MKKKCGRQRRRYRWILGGGITLRCGGRLNCGEEEGEQVGERRLRVVVGYVEQPPAISPAEGFGGR